MDEVVFRSPRKKGRVAVFLSGRGSNFMAIREAVERGEIDGEIALVFSNKAEAPGLLKAREWGLETLSLDPKAFASREDYDQALVAEVEKRRIDLVCLAGYMRVLTPGLCDALKYRIINIHPALLPAFPGLHVQQKAIDWGVRFSGCTTHFVAAEVDMGPIILQACVPVLQDDTEDTLASRILVEEHKIYPQTVRLYFDGRLEVRGRRVFVLEPGA
jgi:phosphoribosylglycinamide formyltransferase-1